MATAPEITAIRELQPDDWPLVEELFGERGACGGCWCMTWRLPHGGKMWKEARGEPNRKAFKKLVTSGLAHGVLAFDGDTPIGWCSFGRREDFPRLATVKAYQRVEPAGSTSIWSINCFYIAKGYRNIGLGPRLAEAAIKAIKRRKGKIIEAYPVPLTANGEKLPAAFVWTGPESIFRKLGFTEVQRLSNSRPLYQLHLK